MVSAKRLAQMTTDECSLTPSSSLVAAKGHFVVYTVDGSRFEVPLPYLGTAVIIELLRMSEDEFGFTSDCRITLPCHVEVMEYVMHLLGRDAPEEVERAFLSSMVWACDHGNGLETSMGLRSVVVSSF